MYRTKEKKLVPACSVHWKQLKNWIDAMVYAGLPKDVIDMILAKSL
jgi:hypothetical protein